MFKSWAMESTGRENFRRWIDPGVDGRTKEEYGKGVATMPAEHAQASLVLGFLTERS